MPDLDSAKIDNKIESLRTILYQIMLNTYNSGEKPSSNNSDDFQAEAAIITYMPLLHMELLEVACGIKALSLYQEAKYTKDRTKANDDTSANKEKNDILKNINDNSFELVNLMKTLSNNQEAYESKQDEQFNDLISNTEDFVESTKDSKKNKKSNILDRLGGSIAGAVSGFTSGLFDTKPRLVVLAKSTIDDIANIFDEYASEDKAITKETAPSKPSAILAKSISSPLASVVTSIGNVITRIGTAITKAINGIATALEIFIYVLFPLVILGAVAIVVIGLYYIAKMVLNFLGDTIASILSSIAESIELVGKAVAGVVDAIADAMSGIIGVIKEYLLAPITLISHAITTLGDILKVPFDNISEGIKSILQAIGTDIGGAIRVITNIIEKIANIYAPVLETISNALSEIIGYVANIIEKFFELYSEKIIVILSKVVDIITDVLSTIGAVVKAISNAVMNFLRPDNIVSRGLGTISSFLFSDNEEESGDTPDYGTAFKNITDPICQSINDFASMVNGFLSKLSIDNISKVIKTNIVGESNINRIDNINSTNSTGSNRNISNDSSSSTNRNSSSVTNTSTNTSTSTDGAPNQAFRSSTMNRYDFDYSSNAMSNGMDNADVVKQIKETNNLLLKVIEMLQGQRRSDFSMIGD